MSDGVKVVELDYAPRRLFLPYHNRTQRFAAMVAHRRCGKTVACVNDIIPKAASLQAADRLGAYLDRGVLDEYADMRPSVCSSIIRPMLSDRLGCPGSMQKSARLMPRELELAPPVPRRCP